MGTIVFTFDLDTTAMKKDELSESERSSIYQSETKKALKESGFYRHLQGSVYATPRAECCLETTLADLAYTLRTRAPQFCMYAKRAMVIADGRIFDFMPAISNRVSAPMGSRAPVEFDKRRIPRITKKWV